MNRVIVAIDGFAGTGKTSLSNMLAEKLGFIHLNTGLVYRGTGLLALNTNTALDDEDSLEQMLMSHKMELVLNDKQEAIMLLDSKDVTQSLFTREVSQAASKVGALPKVRKFLQPIQRTAFSTAKGIVADGRDVGTVLFPDADFKFFINVDADVRAERRVKQLYPDMNDPQELERLKKELVKEIKERDERDLKRGVAPTVPAKDAKIIDNTATTLTETLNFMYHLVADGAG